ncbi:hypothetical protein LTLLF_194350 [Microtus ochrogaster]|uniref:Uncharacterized protein n=1 Tax=Microtus ochrogaster TaxID=79684 RepID=A0A8J6G066_MICOH|nr:hypothetical protein LTLLF_194350 [Microtus ochrogaster]
MASGRRGWDSSHEDDLPVYLARPGTTDQVPRQKYGGMFCNVEGAFESKTLDFDALSVGQRGAKTPRSSQGSGRGAGSRPGVEGDARRGQGREESREPAPESPKSAGVEIRSATGKEVLQNLGPKDNTHAWSSVSLNFFDMSQHSPENIMVQFSTLPTPTYRSKGSAAEGTSVTVADTLFQGMATD